MLTLRNVIVLNCRLLSTRSRAAPKSSLKPETPENVTFKNQNLSNNHMSVTEDGGQRFHGFTYYPRSPGQQDPPYQPSEVLMVQRIQSLKHKPYWEKDVLESFGLSMKFKLSKVVVVANTPSMCAQLWRVKHLIRVTPITFPHGLPDEADTAGARLQENGQLVFIPQLKSDAAVAAMQSRPEERRDYLDTDTVKKHLRLGWIKPY